MTSEEALLKLGEATAEAVANVLRMFSPDGVNVGEAKIVPSGQPLLAMLPMPAVAASVSYVDGVVGGNIFAMTRLGARRLAAAMMMQDPNELEGDEELSELELSAVGEAMNQMMAGAAVATSGVLGEEVDIAPPETKFFSTVDESVDAWEVTPHVVSISFSLLGEPCRLIQLAPNAFIVKMTRAFADLAAETASEDILHRDLGSDTLPEEAVRQIPVRVWAELGRVRLDVAQAIGLGPGEVVELDRLADDPVDLFVNGRRFGSGRLILIDGSDWGVRVESVLPAGAVADLVGLEEAEG